MKEDLWDIHCHILPGIDDGARNWDMTLEMIQSSWNAGVRTMIATPHFLPWGHRLKKETVLELTEQARELVHKDLGIDMEIYPGEELYYHSGTMKDLEQGQALTLGGSRYVLVEFAENASYREIRTAVEQFRRSPWKLIIAHVERYEALYQEKLIKDLLSLGVHLQSNAEEMERGFFDRRKRWLKKRYDAHEIRYLGSDAHDIKHRPPLSDKNLKWFREHLGNEYRKDLFAENARQILKKN